MEKKFALCATKKINIPTLVLSDKKNRNETKNHNPPLQVKWSVPYNGIRTKNHPVWFTPGAAPIRWMGPMCNPRWEQKRTEGYVIVSSVWRILYLKKKKKKVQKFYLKTIHSNTNNTSSIELLNCLSNKHKIVIENIHDDDSGQYI